MTATAIIDAPVLSTATAGGPAFSPREFRDAMGKFATGVVVISTELDGQAHAMTANAFMSGSLEPPLVIVSVAKTARMHEKLQAAGRFGVSVLAQPHLPDSNHFAGKPSEDHEPTFKRVGNLPVIDGALVQVVTDLHHSYACGDHTLFVGHVKALNVAEQGIEPLLFHSGR